MVRDDEGAFHVPALDEEMRYMGVAIDGKLFWDGRDASKRVAELMQEAAGGFAAGVAEVAAPEPVYLGEPVGPTAGPAFDQLEVFNGLLDEEGEGVIVESRSSVVLNGQSYSALATDVANTVSVEDK